MRYTVTLETEDQEIIATANEELVISGYINLSNYKLLHYLDAYGDTVFNRLQMDDLLRDLQKLRNIEVFLNLDEIKQLAQRCKNEAHTYLVFSGD
jgi:hypothetical protein